MKLHLHLGAHRTGTTATQKLLDHHPLLLRAGGVAYLGPDLLRGWGLYETLHRMAEERAESGQIEGTRDVLSEYFAEAGSATRIVMSDENLSDSLLQCYQTASLYPKAAANLSALAKLLPVQPDLVCFTIRDFVSFWQSAFAHLISRKRVRTFDADRLALASANSWLPALQGARAAFPKAQLRIFGYDSTIVRRLTRALVGEELAASLPEAKRTLGLALGQDSAAQLKSLPTGAERDRLSLALRADRDTPDRTFSVAQAQLLAQAYARDWSALTAGAVEGADLDPGQILELSEGPDWQA